MHLGDIEVITLFLDGDAHTSEGVGDDAQVFDRYVLDADAIAHHSCHADKRAHLNHIGQDGVFRTVQVVHTLDGQQV